MRRSKRDALILQLTIATVVLLGLNTILLVVLLFRSGTSAPATTSAPASAPSTASSGLVEDVGASPAVASAAGAPEAPAGGASAIETVLLATIAPLSKAAGDFGLDLATVIPSDTEVEACVASDSVASVPCAEVISTLEAGYASVNMPFPDLASNMDDNAPPPSESPDDGEGPGDPPPAPPPGADEPLATEEPAAAGGGQRDILRAFFSVTVERLAQQAKMQGLEAEIAVPSDAEIETAAASGSLDSEECRALLEHMRTQYRAVGLEFPEPIF